ncbi:hypothetical protein PCYB_005330, partial [Plasmodium cynomolgi strain B]
IPSGKDFLYLPTELFYLYINLEHNDLSIYSNRCDSIKLESINLKEHVDEVKRICKKVLRHLEKNDRIWYISVHKNEVCTLFNYWVYSQLANILGSDESSIILAFGELQRSLHNKCEPDFNIPQPADWKKRKNCMNIMLIMKIFYLRLSTMMINADIKIKLMK